MKVFTMVILMSSLLLLPAFAAAQAEDAPGQDATYTFDGDDIDATRPGPLGEDIGVRSNRQTTSLITVRSTFVPEILKSVESL